MKSLTTKILILTVCSLFSYLSCKSIQPYSAVKDDTKKHDYSQINTANDYRSACKDAGVPLPDIPVSNQDYWSVRNLSKTTVNQPHFGELSHNSELLVHSRPDSSGCTYIVDKYVSEKESSTTFRKAGAICWSRDGTACFWEGNNIPKTAKNTVQDSYIISADDKAHPFSGVMQVSCTSCHRGDNVTIGHGEDGPADKIYNEISTVEFKRSVAPDTWDERELLPWPENTAGKPSQQCAEGCHSIPTLTPFYCSMSINMLRSGLMLAADFGISSDRQPTREECKPYIAIVKECQELMSGFSAKPTMGQALGKCSKFLSIKDCVGSECSSPKTKSCKMIRNYHNNLLEVCQ